LVAAEILATWLDVLLSQAVIVSPSPAASCVPFSLMVRLSPYGDTTEEALLNCLWSGFTNGGMKSAAAMIATMAAITSIVFLTLLRYEASSSVIVVVAAGLRLNANHENERSG
jgi:hypothetical protein